MMRCRALRRRGPGWSAGRCLNRSFTERAYGVSASVTCAPAHASARGVPGTARPRRAARPYGPAAPARRRGSCRNRYGHGPGRPGPLREFGRVAAWIGNGAVTPCEPSVVSGSRGLSRSAKPTAGSAGVSVSGRANSPWTAAGRACRNGRSGSGPTNRIGRHPCRSHTAVTGAGERVVRTCALHAEPSSMRHIAREFPQRRTARRIAGTAGGTATANPADGNP